MAAQVLKKAASSKPICVGARWMQGSWNFCWWKKRQTPTHGKKSTSNGKQQCIPCQSCPASHSLVLFRSGSSGTETCLGIFPPCTDRIGIIISRTMLHVKQAPSRNFSKHTCAILLVFGYSACSLWGTLLLLCQWTVVVVTRPFMTWKGKQTMV